MMPSCTACGGHISADFERVFATASGLVTECPACEPASLVDGD